MNTPLNLIWFDYIFSRRLAEVLQREGEEATQREQLFQEFKQNHLGGHEQLTE